MKVVILCGGYGTRIRDVADDLPKPMIPVGNYPIIWHIMKYYATMGHNEFILCLGYKMRQIWWLVWSLGYHGYSWLFLASLFYDVSTFHSCCHSF